jgi:hypothetical protein
MICEQSDSFSEGQLLLGHFRPHGSEAYAHFF